MLRGKDDECAKAGAGRASEDASLPRLAECSASVVVRERDQRGAGVTFKGADVQWAPHLVITKA